MTTRVPLRQLVAELAGSLGQPEAAVLGKPVAIDLRWRRDDRGLFISGVPADLLDQIAGAFAKSFDTGAFATPLVDEWWSSPSGRGIGTGPAFLCDDRGAPVPVVTRELAPDEPTKLEQAQALRAQFAVAATRLEASLADPLDAGVLLAALDGEPVDAAAVLDDIADSRRLVGRYLLDAGDDFDDERVDQLGDGYVRAGEIWGALAGRSDPDLVGQLMALERACLDWMLGAAAPPTRYAF